MSSALQCDSCGTFYVEGVGCVTVEHYTVCIEEGAGEIVSEDGTADLCAKCAPSFLQQVGHEGGES